MRHVFQIFDVLRKGRRVVRVEFWKTASAVTAAVAFVLPDALSLACSFGYCVQMTQHQINDAAASLGGVVAGLFVLHSILATTEKIGF